MAFIFFFVLRLLLTFKFFILGLGITRNGYCDLKESKKWILQRYFGLGTAFVFFFVLRLLLMFKFFYFGLKDTLIDPKLRLHWELLAANTHLYIA